MAAASPTRSCSPTRSASPCRGRSAGLVSAVARLGVPVGAHLHNTRNTGYANALAALEAGAALLDASLGGIGGCPFAPRATGNIATEDLVYLLHGEGIETGVDLDALIGSPSGSRACSGTSSRARSIAPAASHPGAPDRSGLASGRHVPRSDWYARGTCTRYSS